MGKKHVLIPAKGLSASQEEVLHHWSLVTLCKSKAGTVRVGLIDTFCMVIHMKKAVSHAIVTPVGHEALFGSIHWFIWLRLCWSRKLRLVIFIASPFSLCRLRKLHLIRSITLFCYILFDSLLHFASFSSSIHCFILHILFG